MESPGWDLLTAPSSANPHELVTGLGWNSASASHEAGAGYRLLVPKGRFSSLSNLIEMFV